MARREWDPEAYAEFSELRARAFWDLAELIDVSDPIRSMADLGCGTGELTAALAGRLDVESALGIDSSPAMIAGTSEHGSDRVAFTSGDIGTWHAERPVDLVVANASLQWVPDHRDVLERWVESLRPGGQIAVQVPANADHPSHVCSAAVARREPFASAMGGTPPPDPVADNVLLPEEYAAILHALRVDDPHVRLQVYPQVMPSSAAVVDWVRGTSLTRFFRVLPDHFHDSFVDAYRSELLATIGAHSPYFYAFKRILMCGRRS